MVRLREKAEKKRESRPLLRVGSTSRFLRPEKKKADRGEKSALRDGDQALEDGRMRCTQRSYKKAGR